MIADLLTNPLLHHGRFETLLQSMGLESLPTFPVVELKVVLKWVDYYGMNRLFTLEGILQKEYKQGDKKKLARHSIVHSNI
jgi:hypothetical protein